MKTRNNITTTMMLLALSVLALSPGMQAVSPAPDGGYPGGNTAEGTDALLVLTTGAANTAVGAYSLAATTSGTQNTANGYAALNRNTTGSANTANGYAALDRNTTGSANTANGYQALYGNTTGVHNTASGFDALFSNTTGNFNTANGYQALEHNTIGTNNTANGLGALSANTTGGFNTAIGDSALELNTTGGGNIALGDGAGSNVTTANNVICIGAYGNNVSNSCYIGNIFGATSSGGTTVFVNGAGRLGTATSSRRFKEEIKPMDKASEALFALKPITFRYKKQVDPEGTSAMQFGLVAEDVEKVNPDLIIRDKKGKPYTVRYEQINAMLLNEFLKEHRRVAKLETTVAQQQTSFQSRLAEQTMQIQALASGLQKVSARVEMSKPATKVVSTRP